MKSCVLEFLCTLSCMLLENAGADFLKIFFIVQNPTYFLVEDFGKRREKCLFPYLQCIRQKATEIQMKHHSG